MEDVVVAAVILQVLKWQMEVFPDKRTLFDRISELVVDQTQRSIKEVGTEEIEAVSLTEDFFDGVSLCFWERKFQNFCFVSVGLVCP